MPKRGQSPSTAQSWWLGTGHEDCPHCGQSYLYELEFRCTECDGPGCMHCKSWHVDGYWLCPTCTPASAKRDRKHGR
jgi:hypothetical protein